MYISDTIILDFTIATMIRITMTIINLQLK